MDARPSIPDSPPPLVLEIGPSQRDRETAIAWARENRQPIEDALHRAGAVLIRGFEIADAASFRAFCAAIRPDLRNYAGGDSPRTSLADQVYTSTEYPAHLEVLLHNELSYAGWSPDRVFFGCLIPAETGGETHIADGREICARLDPTARARFENRGVAYLQHLWDAEGAPGIGKSWQETFETGDRAAAEAYLRESEMDFEWTPLGLRTRARKEAIRAHPVTGEQCWWCQADQWHRDIESVKASFGGGEDPRFDPATAGEATLGNHATFGDGSPIDVADLMHVREVMRGCEVTFPWRAGDVMALDNVLAMHGRKPFTGQRRVLVAMA